jgi:CHAT domain-containing protein/Flp pilus assembly protein TadD
MPEAAHTRAEWVKQLCSEAPTSSRRDLFEQRSEWHDADTLRVIHAELIRCLYADQPRARRLGEIARWAADAAGDNFSLATCLRCEGHVHYAEARYEASIESYRKALRLLDANEAEAGRIYFGGLQPLIYLGRYEEAHHWAERAQAIFESHHDTARLARLDLNVGNIFFRQDRYEDALVRYRQALPVLEKSTEPQDYAAVVSNIAVCCIYLGQFRQALEYYQSVRDWCAQHKLQTLVAGADYNIAYLHYLRGDYRKAMELYGLSRQQCEDTGDAYHCALCDLDESEMLLELNMVTEAGQLADRAAGAFDHLGMNYERAKATVNRAVACFRRGDSAKAGKLFHEARKLFAREDNRYWRAILDLYQALVCEHDGLLDEARRFSERALGVLAHSPLAGKLALCNSLLARLFMGEGNLPAARDRLRDMEKTLYSPALRFQFHYLRGAVHEKSNEWDSASHEYVAAIHEMEEARRALWVEELKISFLQDKTEIYAAVTRLSLARGQAGLPEAFSWVQQAKSRSLLERLYEEPSHQFPDQPADHEQITELRRNLTAHYRQLEVAAGASRAPASENIRALRLRIQEGEQQLVRLWGTANRQTIPNHNNFDFLPTQTIQQTLPPNTSLVEFFPIGDRMHAFVLTANTLHHVAGSRIAPMKESFRLLQFQLSKFTLGPEYAAKFQSALYRAANLHLAELYQALIEPIRGFLRGQRVVFAPSGFLHHVPFHALIDAGGHSLIEHFTISYAPSASIFARCALRPASTARGSLILAVPDAAAPRISQEAAAIRDILPEAELLLGDETSPEALETRGAAKRYLHIAAHGLLRRDNPLFSAIRLGESRLQLFDLRHMRLDADLVTLSGCSTGVSVVTGADELVGLMRGILGAGARSLLASLWDVNDESTTKFMISFYRHFFADGASDKAGAVRKAMLEIRQSHPHLYFWAPFALVCGDSPLL